MNPMNNLDNLVQSYVFDTLDYISEIDSKYVLDVVKKIAIPLFATYLAISMSSCQSTNNHKKHPIYSHNSKAKSKYNKKSPGKPNSTFNVKKYHFKRNK